MIQKPEDRPSIDMTVSETDLSFSTSAL